MVKKGFRVVAPLSVRLAHEQGGEAGLKVLCATMQAYNTAE